MVDSGSATTEGASGVLTGPTTSRYRLPRRASKREVTTRLPPGAALLDSIHHCTRGKAARRQRSRSSMYEDGIPLVFVAQFGNL
jgi:hypothetical protein